MKRTDQQAIEDIMAVNNDIEFRVRIIEARTTDAQIKQEVAGIRRNVNKARHTLNEWWRLARRRKGGK